jgi:hypothetical protein
MSVGSFSDSPSFAPGSPTFRRPVRIVRSDHAIGDLGFPNRNSVTSGVSIEVFAFSIRNITLILNGAPRPLRSYPVASAFAHLVRGELSDCDPIAIRRCALGCPPHRQRSWLWRRHRS